MSIVPLSKVTMIGLTEDKEPLLRELLDLGCVDIIPLQTVSGEGESTRPPAGAEEALKFLRDCPARRRHQVRDSSRFDPLEVERKVLEVRKRLLDLEEERDFLIKRLRDLAPWGDFEFPGLDEMGGYRLWFYVVTHADMPKIRVLPYYQEEVKRDNRFHYVVLISQEEPRDVPIPRVHVGNRSRLELSARLDEVELAIEDTQAERAWLTRWYHLLKRNLAQLMDRAAVKDAGGKLLHHEPLVALQGWAPEHQVPVLAGRAGRRNLAFQAEEPHSEEQPPTLLHNPSFLSAGEDLVNFYMTPGYRTWDPSAIVFISFSLFFAMILADAGYAALLGLGLWLYWRKLGSSSTGRRYRPLLLSIVVLSVCYGVLVGSYFGVSPPADTLPGKLHLLDMSDTNLMMSISVLIGCLHVILANMMDALRYPRLTDGLAPVGWAFVVSAGLVLVLGGGFGLHLPLAVPLTLAGIGLVMVLVWTAPQEPPVKRALKGVLGLTNVTGAFGDVLSYLRLFALGLASGSLATQFNQMSASLVESMPGIGFLIAILVLILGHAVNLSLGLASGVIHGLRLNVIEFFKWGLKEEGRPFRPLKRTQR